MIAELIPHAGAMVLIDRVESYDATRLRCVATSHRAADNPLRSSDGRLSALAGLEYAGQAMAVHGALTGATSEQPRRGYLASARDVQLGCDTLDGLATLVIEVEALAIEAQRVLYQFRLSSEDATVLTGRAAVVLEAAP
ncbi:MAG: putative beta-hydroxyacyl-acyl carrier protein (ACP)-dehydratase [Rhodospirillales bacterium]|nr:putative beta-hydroxyacyl-acyl carrier protein (ACP)-dehydratase [Rhodospirillales bacterium]